MLHFLRILRKVQNILILPPQKIEETYIILPSEKKKKEMSSRSVNFEKEEESKKGKEKVPHHKSLQKEDFSKII